MAADTATKQNDTKPAGPAKAATKRKSASRAKAKPAKKSRSTRTAAKARKPAAAPTTRSQTTATPTTTATETPGAQEKAVTAIVDYQTRAAALSQIPGATAVAEAQAQVLRSVTGAYVSAARAFLK